MDEKNEILIVTGDAGTRGFSPAKVDASQLAVNVNLFLEQMGSVLDKTPSSLGSFQFVEFEVHAEVTGKGKLAILGVGGEAGATGGLKFVFRRSTGKSE